MSGEGYLRRAKSLWCDVSVITAQHRSSDRLVHFPVVAAMAILRTRKELGGLIVQEYIEERCRRSHWMVVV
jgi:hypothetical protein